MKTHTDRPLCFDRSHGLDLTAFNLRSMGGQFFARKADAAQFALARGWRIGDVHKAFNRFNVFWIVGQQVSSRTYRVVGMDGWVDLTFGEANRA